MMRKPLFRAMTSEEAALVSRLIETPFAGNGELAGQVAHALVREIAGAGDHYGSIEFRVESDARSPVAVSVPAEARGFDEDGVEVDFLLHVRNGRLGTLEVVKADVTAIKRLPAAKTLVVGLVEQRN